WWSAHPWLATVLVLVLLSVVAARSVIGGSLHGGALPPPPEDAGQWWSLFYSGWHDVGMGSSAAGPAFALLLAVASIPLWFSPATLITLLMVFAVPMAGLTAHRFGRRLSTHRGVRIAWALSYAAAVAASGALAQGRIGTLLALILLPVIAGAGWRLINDPSWQTGIRLGLWIAAASAFAPIVYPLVVLAILAAGLVRTARSARTPQTSMVAPGRAAHWAHIVVAIVVPWPLLGVWLVERIAQPLRVWQEAGLAAAGHATSLDVLFGRGGGAGSAPGWMSVGLIVLAALALIPARSRRGVTAAWLIALLGLAAASWGM